MSEQNVSEPEPLISKTAIVRLDINGQFHGAVEMAPAESDKVLRAFLEAVKVRHSKNAKPKEPHA